MIAEKRKLFFSFFQCKGAHCCGTDASIPWAQCQHSKPLYTAHNQFLYFVHSGQFRADAKRCV